MASYEIGWTEKEYRAATVRERAANNGGMPKCPLADARGSERRAMNAGLVYHRACPNRTVETLQE